MAKKNKKKNDKSKGTIDPFDSDSDYDNEPLKLIRNNTEVEEEDDVDFSFYRYPRKSKKQMIEKLEVVGALDQVGVSKNNEHIISQQVTQKKMTIQITTKKRIVLSMTTMMILISIS